MYLCLHGGVHVGAVVHLKFVFLVVTKYVRYGDKELGPPVGEIVLRAIFFNRHFCNGGHIECSCSVFQCHDTARFVNAIDTVATGETAHVVSGKVAVLHHVEPSGFASVLFRLLHFPFHVIEIVFVCLFQQIQVESDGVHLFCRCLWVFIAKNLLLGDDAFLHEGLPFGCDIDVAYHAPIVVVSRQVVSLGRTVGGFVGTNFECQAVFVAHFKLLCHSDEELNIPIFE